MARKLEDFTKDTTFHYAGLRVRVEARAAFEQAERIYATQWRRWVSR